MLRSPQDSCAHGEVRPPVARSTGGGASHAWKVAVVLFAAGCSYIVDFNAVAPPCDAGRCESGLVCVEGYCWDGGSVSGSDGGAKDGGSDGGVRDGGLDGGAKDGG
jgi:hypothetical protein